MQRTLVYAAAATVATLVLDVSLATPWASQATPAAVAVDSDDIGGIVSSPRGPEAGVWVIAETFDLPTRYSKTVVTDDQGRYVIPGLPKGNQSKVVHFQLRPNPLSR